MNPALKSFYGHRWRTITRPALLIKCRTYGGYRCQGPCARVLHSDQLDGAHLVVQAPAPGHDAPENVAMLCRRCHRAHDYESWARKCYETRCARKDRARPLLQEAQT